MIGENGGGTMRWRWKRPARWGTVLLGVWLIATGVLQLVPALAFQGSGLILTVLAIAAGVLLLLDR
jgi:uncharacterized membrane protein HdeD (DUF308 family)